MFASSCDCSDLDSFTIVLRPEWVNILSDEYLIHLLPKTDIEPSSWIDCRHCFLSNFVSLRKI